MTSVPLYTLPIELLEGFLAEVEYPDLANARNVSQAWRTLCNSTAIPIERKQLLQLRQVARNDKTTAVIRSRIDPFLIDDFDRERYLARIGDAVPEEFARWIFETPAEDIIGWHWPGLRGEHDRGRFEELGLNFIDDMMFSRHLKPGYTLLPCAKIMDVEDPDDSDFSDTDDFNPGAWPLEEEEPEREPKVRALQIWADLSTSSPKITLLILSGSERWNGTVWLTETRMPFRHSPETMNEGIQLVWQRSLGTWTDYLKSECQSLQERYTSMAEVRSYRSGYAGNRVPFIMAEDEL